MTRNLIIATLAILAAIFGARAFMRHGDECGECASGEKHSEHPRPAAAPRDDQGPHGGCLNEIGSCETGHAEVIVKDGEMRLYLLSGGHGAATSVRVAAKNIVLSSSDADGAERTITLEPEPIKLAGEKLGDCSCFVGSAGWLADIDEFEARGQLMFRGAIRPIVIHYPGGYAPSHAQPHVADEPTK